MAAFFAQASQSNANSVAVTSSAMLHHPPGLPLISAQVNPVQTAVQPPMSALQVGLLNSIVKISRLFCLKTQWARKFEKPWQKLVKI